MRKKATDIIKEKPLRIGRHYYDLGRETNYMDVTFNEDKFADAKDFLPAEFDLCHLVVKGKDKCVPGWHTGTIWDGLNVKSDYDVLAWKLNYDT